VAAERAGWQPRASSRPDRSGKIWACKFTVVHDCGLIINPDGLRRRIEGNVVQGTSRALSEEVTFDRAKVASTDCSPTRSSTSLRRRRRSTSC
jgi:hypothetical protein